MWLAHRRRNPRDVTPSPTIAYAATMVKQSLGRAL